MAGNHDANPGCGRINGPLGQIVDQVNANLSDYDAGTDRQCLCEILARGDAVLDFVQEQTAGGCQVLFRRQRRQAGGDQIGVGETPAARHRWQVLQREGGFARAVGAGDYPAGGNGSLPRSPKIIRSTSALVSARICAASVWSFFASFLIV